MKKHRMSIFVPLILSFILTGCNPTQTINLSDFSPANEKVVYYTTRSEGIVLTWPEINEAEKYQLEFADNQEFFDAFSPVPVSGTSYTLHALTHDNDLYYWRICPVFEKKSQFGKKTEWVGPFVFRALQSEIEPIQPIIDGSAEIGDDQAYVDFSWELPPSGYSLIFEIALDESFEHIIMETSVRNEDRDFSFLIDPYAGDPRALDEEYFAVYHNRADDFAEFRTPEGDVTFYYRLITVNSDGYEAYSDVFTFSRNYALREEEINTSYLNLISDSAEGHEIFFVRDTPVLTYYLEGNTITTVQAGESAELIRIMDLCIGDHLGPPYMVAEIRIGEITGYVKCENFLYSYFQTEKGLVIGTSITSRLVQDYHRNSVENYPVYILSAYQQGSRLSQSALFSYYSTSNDTLALEYMNVDNMALEDTTGNGDQELQLHGYFDYIGGHYMSGARSVRLVLDPESMNRNSDNKYIRSPEIMMEEEYHDSDEGSFSRNEFYLYRDLDGDGLRETVLHRFVKEYYEDRYDEVFHGEDPYSLLIETTYIWSDQSGKYKESDETETEVPVDYIPEEPELGPNDLVHVWEE